MNIPDTAVSEAMRAFHKSYDKGGTPLQNMRAALEAAYEELTEPLYDEIEELKREVYYLNDEVYSLSYDASCCDGGCA